MWSNAQGRKEIGLEKSLIVGIDASRAVTGAPTGTEYYSWALIDALLRSRSGFHFRLYTRTTPPSDFFPATENYEIRAMPWTRLWTHLRLSYEMLTRPPDVLFVPAHVLPPLHPRKSLVTVHDLGYRYFPEAHPSPERVYLDISTRRNVMAARVVIADSYATRDDIVRMYGAPREKIRVVYPSYNEGLYRPTREAGEIERVRARYGLETTYIISVGTIQPRKNYGRLIEAFAMLTPGHTLVIAGKKGWRAEELEGRVSEAGLTGRVKFVDYVPPEDLPALYAGAELAIFPSLYEGFGFPALEAQACETPLVCSNVSSLPEVAGEGALYFDPQSAAGMAEAMECVLEDPTLRASLVERGRENVARFGWARAASEIVETITGL